MCINSKIFCVNYLNLNNRNTFPESPTDAFGKNCEANLDVQETSSCERFWKIVLDAAQVVDFLLDFYS